jgi:hypothetical protein
MKINISVLKFYVVLPFILWTISLNAQTRKVKMEYKIIDPIRNKEIRMNESIPVSIRFYNYGPDTLWTCDSFYFSISVSQDYDYTRDINIFVLDAPLSPGDSSSLITDTAYWEWPYEIKNDRYVYVNTKLTLLGIDYTHPKASVLLLSGVEGQNENSSVQLILRVKTASADEITIADKTLVLYPNPISGHTASLKGIEAGSITAIECVDVTGKIFTCAYHARNNETAITLPSGLSGIYFLSIKTKESVICKKVIIKN